MPSMRADEAATLTDQLQTSLTEAIEGHEGVTRRAVLGGLAMAGGSALAGVGAADEDHGESEHGHFGATGAYDGSRFDPFGYLREFNTGAESGSRAAIGGRSDGLNAGVYEEDGRTVREFDVTAIDLDLEILPGITMPLWTYNGQVPGPTLRAEEGDLIRVNFVNGSRKHAHTIHPHLRNLNPRMDGIPQNGPGVLDPGESFTYEWIAQPAGTHLYHCHSLPLKAHIHRGLYGVIVVDPDPERVRENPREYLDYHGPITEAVRERAVRAAKSRNMISYPDFVPEGYDGIDEQVMVMNGFDTNFDGSNEVYAANTRGFCYAPAESDGKGDWESGPTRHPIQVDRADLVRIHLVQATEFDFVNSFHTHSQFFDYYDAGTSLFPNRSTIDTVLLCQAQRGVLEMDYRDHEPGLYMFHAHQSEFAELGWMSFFEVS